MKRDPATIKIALGHYCLNSPKALAQVDLDPISAYLNLSAFECAARLLLQIYLFNLLDFKSYLLFQFILHSFH